MKVKEIIKALQNMYDADDHIVVAWWDKEGLADLIEETGMEIEEIDWIMEKFDWSSTHDDMSEYVRFRNQEIS